MILKVAIVEDDPVIGPLMNDTLKRLGMEPVLHITGADALKNISGTELPRVVLMDLNLPDYSGIDLTRELKERYPQLEIIVHTVVEDTKTILDAIKSGASGYVLKSCPEAEMDMAIRVVLEGGSHLTGRVAKKVLGEFKEGVEAKPKDFGLTAREEDILRNLIQGYSYKKIADIQCLSVHTVNNYIRRIYEKLQVSSRSEAVAKTLAKKG